MADSVCGFWLERYIPVTPSLVHPENVFHEPPGTVLGRIELCIGASFVGAFFLCFLTVARVFPGTVPTKS